MNELAVWRKQAEIRLASCSASPRVDVEYLLLHVLQKNRLWLRLNEREILSDGDISTLESLLKRREQGEPVAYLTGERGFWSMDLQVNASTLIPRADTELLVETALEKLARTEKNRVLDLGTGSGAIALAIKYERPLASVVAVDASAGALDVAKKNAKRLSLDVQFLPGSWFDPVQHEKFDVIVSNPPYLAPDDVHLAEGDLRFEPVTALVADENGLADLRKISEAAPQHLWRNGWLMLEHGLTQGEAVRQLLGSCGFSHVETRCDIEGRERVTLGQWLGKSKGDDPQLSDDELLRYSRQIMLPEFDVAAQEKLKTARILIVGLGGIGSPVALYLASAGAGELVLADFDTVDVSNLQRQILHGENDVGREKILSGYERLKAQNSLVKLRLVEKALDADTLPSLLETVDLVIDGCDNFSTRDAVNAACVAAKKPLVSAAAIGFAAQLSVFDSRQPDSPCYRCLYPDADEAAATCSENGVLATVPGMVGLLAATEAIKVITGVGQPLVGRLWLYEALSTTMRTLSVRRDPACLVCGPSAP